MGKRVRFRDGLASISRRTNSIRLRLAQWILEKLNYYIEETAYFKSVGAPISKTNPREGGKLGTMGGSLALADKLAHPNATVVFANWILGKEGGTYFQKGFANPSSRMDVSKETVEPMLLPRPDEKFYIEDEETIKLARVMVEFSKEVFAPLMK